MRTRECEHIPLIGQEEPLLWFSLTLMPRHAREEYSHFLPPPTMSMYSHRSVKQEEKVLRVAVGSNVHSVGCGNGVAPWRVGSVFKYR